MFGTRDVSRGYSTPLVTVKHSESSLFIASLLSNLDQSLDFDMHTLKKTVTGSLIQ